MVLSVGDRVGRFEILGSLGVGGMGEVYRARDDQLKRDVAIKVLPAAFSDDVGRRRRFEQEARAAGALNHPNILAVYDVGVERGSSYIVTEVLEGETLRDRMGGRPLPPARALAYARQVATGLAAAHDHGVVHRDIKPGNLFVTTDGRIKILDFGLAKLSGPDASLNTETVSMNESMHAVMGTAAYMSPELARGLRVDHRTDIFSFGIVLYEMLAGFPPFQRVSVGETLNAIIHDEPEALPSSAAAGPALERVVRHCLEKQPEQRFQNFHDLLFHLDNLPHEGRLRARGSRRMLRAGAAFLALSAAAVLGALLGRSLFPGPPSTVAHRARAMTDFIGLEEFPAISPDGNMVAFTAAQSGRRQVFIRFVNTGPARAVTSDESDHQLPRWEPDGSSLVYFSPAAPGEVQGAIYRVPTLGGSVQRVISSIGGGDVSRRGRLACFRLERDRIQLVTATLEGSDVHVVTTLDTRHYQYPRWSPDNKWIAYQAGDGFRWDIYVAAADGSSEPLLLTDDNRFVAGLSWLPDSSGIVFASSRGSTQAYSPPLALWEVPVKGGRPPRQLTPAEVSYEQPDVHASGVISVARLRMTSDIWRYPLAADQRQHEQYVTRQTLQVLTPTAAPDGDRIAYLSESGGHSNIWVMSAKGPPRQITFEDDPAVSIGVPIWSPDGEWIAFVSSKGNTRFMFGLWLVRPDGSELHQLVPHGLGMAWAPDGREIYFIETASSPIKKISLSGGSPVIVRPEPVRNIIGVHETTVYFLVEHALMDGRPEFEIRAAPLGGGPSRTIKTIGASRVATWQVPFNPSLSPDGKWLAMPLLDGLTTNIWVLSTEKGEWQQVTDFGDRAMIIARRVSWSADGRSIFAAVGEGDADIVLLDGLIEVKR